MKCDYEKLGLEFISRALNENSVRLSRTRKGVSDTSTSVSKRSLLLAGKPLEQRSAENELHVHGWLWEHRQGLGPLDPSEIFSWVISIADLTNAQLLPAGRFREWPISGKVEPELIPNALRSFCESIHARWHELEVDPVPLASWSEWQLNGGSLHPFYDGCGRIARSFSALLLIRASSILPLFDNLKSYFENGNKGEGTFSQYYRARIRDCVAWSGRSLA